MVAVLQTTFNNPVRQIPKTIGQMASRMTVGAATDHSDQEFLGFYTVWAELGSYFVVAFCKYFPQYRDSFRLKDDLPSACQ